MVANILPIDTLPDPWGGVTMSKFNFSGHGHVAYQIKRSDECSTMQAHIMSSNPRVESNVKRFFSERILVAYQINSNGA